MIRDRIGSLFSFGKAKVVVSANTPVQDSDEDDPEYLAMLASPEADEAFEALSVSIEEDKKAGLIKPCDSW